MSYLFGDTDIAVRRLAVLDEVFAPTTRAFLEDSAPGKPSLVLDLGCGPGYTTHRLLEILQCERAVGLDSSGVFIAFARRSERERVSFHRHDVTAMPLPTAPADLLYCRFLITHLTDPRVVLDAWATQLRPGGLLLLEETESIRTENGVVRTYLEIVDRMLAAQSNRLYVGPTLAGMPDPPGLRRRMDRVAPLRVAEAQAATLFVMNMQVWKSHAFIRERYPEREIQRMEKTLRALSEAESRSEVEWGLRQIAFERA